MTIFKKIETEVNSYLYDSVEISEGVYFSQSKLVSRIYLFKNKVYPKGKVDKQGHYKQWPDIIGPRVNSEIKNLRIDTKSPTIFSQSPIKDFPAVFIANMRMKEFLWETGRAEEFNENTENFSGDGNILLKKTKNGYEATDPTNTYIINQSAKTVDETAVIERHELTQSELRAKKGVWDDDVIEEVIKECGDKKISANKKTSAKETTNKYYEIFERNGEVTEKELFEAQGKEGGKEDVYVNARIIVSIGKSAKDGENYVLFAEPLGNKKLSDIYLEGHRGTYKGRWWREGMYELLFDYQIRANEIANDLARGLNWASKVVFRSADNRTVQNILTDVANGDIIKSADLAQVDVRMQGLDQLIADWNRLMQDADRVANSFEIVTGEEMKGNVPFRLGLLMDTNVNKLFYFLRQKLGIVYNRAFKEWILPELIKKLKGEDIIRVTGDAGFIDKFRRMEADNWYALNLARIGPHTPEIAEALKEAKYQELSKNDPYIKNSKKIWEDVLPRLWVSITGENIDFNDEYQTISSLLQFETDPIRRAFLLDRIYSMKGLPVPPKVQAQVPQVPQSSQAGQRSAGGGEGIGEESKGVSEFSSLQTGVK